MKELDETQEKLSDTFAEFHNNAGHAISAATRLVCILLVYALMAAAAVIVFIHDQFQDQPVPEVEREPQPEVAGATISQCATPVHPQRQWRLLSRSQHQVSS
jgi:hypothetical protein